MMFFVRPSSSISPTVMDLFPSRFRKAVLERMSADVFVTLLLILFVMPVAIDGFYQLLTPYESTNLKRVLSGIPTGWIGGVLIGAMVVSISEFKREIKNALVHQDTAVSQTDPRVHEPDRTPASH